MLSDKGEIFSKKILKYWHQLEFFQPYSIQEKLDSKVIRCCLYPNQLKDENLPWLNAESLVGLGGVITKRYRFHLYLGLFDKSELTALATELYSGPKEPWESVELEERLAKEGKTCFAKLVLNSKGAPQWHKFSVSTLPWALGRLRGTPHLQIDQASYDVEQEVLQEYIARIPLVKRDQAEVIDANGLYYLLQGLFNWARFHPDEQPLLAIELQELPYRVQENLLEDLNTRLPISAKNMGNSRTTEESEIGILNSFYIKDLEQIIRDSNDSIPLKLYLAGNVRSRVDLSTKKGAAQIAYALQPNHAPVGRWPNPVSHYTNAMQQFALNTALNYKKDGGLFSINGPPGTGKTTLIREIIADNLVKRAIALSQLDDPQKAFVKTEKISFGNHKHAYVSFLDPSLLGYEMVIASSNNAAVENISKELPSKKTVTGDLSFLESVANKLRAVHDEFGNVKPLREEEMCWGTISVALGNLRNCQAFLSKGFMLKSADEKRYQTFWQWAKSYCGPSFDEAKTQFRKKLCEFGHLNASLSEYSELRSWLPKTSLKAQTERETRQLIDIEKKIADQRVKGQRAKEELDAAYIEFFLSDQTLYAITECKPPWYRRLFDWDRWQNYKQQWAMHNYERLLHLEKVAHCSEELGRQQGSLDDSIHQQRIVQKELDEKRADFEKKKHRYHVLEETFCDIDCLPEELSIDSSDFHTRSFWQNDTLNKLRSELFVLGMILHEAWLASVLQSRKGFGGNLVAIGHLLSGKTPTTPDATMAIWQSLFMLVPVVSSTFASISRLFRGVTASQIGWLIIDEAGQAVPQAAAGAIWRASRVIVMGDPQQIEPVLMIPPKLADIMGQTFLGDRYTGWTPTLVSVQSLSDDQNPFGIYIRTENESTWVGSPLRVHRRCQNPMFQIANEIAYAGGMVQTVGPDELGGLNPSCWYHVPGKAADKQYVAEQGDFILAQLQNMLDISNMLPSVYIISPFRRVKDRIRDLIANHLSPLNESKKEELRRWANKHIGTVHTFQGKEEDVVFFVLGGDSDKEGALVWASQKPNLLNVALTRAKKRVYIVGDVNIWGNKPFFQVAAKYLPVVQSL